MNTRIIDISTVVYLWVSTFIHVFAATQKVTRTNRRMAWLFVLRIWTICTHIRVNSLVLLDQYYSWDLHACGGGGGEKNKTHNEESRVYLWLMNIISDKLSEFNYLHYLQIYVCTKKQAVEYQCFIDISITWSFWFQLNVSWVRILTILFRTKMASHVEYKSNMWDYPTRPKLLDIQPDVRPFTDDANERKLFTVAQLNRLKETYGDDLKNLKDAHKINPSNPNLSYFRVKLITSIFQTLIWIELKKRSMKNFINCATTY